MYLESLIAQAMAHRLFDERALPQGNREAA